jgi:hypothetical protein
VKFTLRLLAAALVLGVSVWWFLAGADRGWTKTQVPVTTFDEVTGITGITSYEKRLVPGLEVLGLAWLGGAALAGASFFCRSKSPQSIQQRT